LNFLFAQILDDLLIIVQKLLSDRMKIIQVLYRIQIMPEILTESQLL